ncbi:NADP oxidoreductase coenzyme F420-dependent [Xanthobacter versatilis]|uniref:NADP oxidoreductase coenzyme F420-dependent n=1 Tax=Xanthobacter autotrophicus (strain ATCC BAA-1158 / Py2) TaxID=78245 RepID=A7IBM7_XANP2|nr:NADP oxidoreductase coenzyme F420-dependent [Xanthobacter autotrophicus Py2]
MRVAIIGAGNVGASLGKGWARAGHAITFGVIDPADPRLAAPTAAAGGAELAPVAEAKANADAIVLAVPWDAVPAAIAALGDLSGRLVIDATNPLRMGASGLELALGFSTSGGEEVARLAPGASVLKAMNQVGFAVMSDTAGYPARPVIFVAGDDAARKPQVLALVADLGFEVVDAGPLDRARLLEPYAMLWIDQALSRGAPADNAFAFMRKQAVAGAIEYIRYALTVHDGAALTSAYVLAAPHLQAAPECLGYDLTQCDEDPTSFILRIQWVSAQAHMEGFRRGPHFPPFLAAIRDFIPEIAEMRHYAPTAIAWRR